MSIGFRKTEPPPPPREDVVWLVVKDGKRAHAAIRMLEHGAELRVYVNDQLIVSHLHRDAALNVLQKQSAEYRARFEAKGWAVE